MLALVVLVAIAVILPAIARAEDDPWPDLRASLFGSRPTVDDGSIKIVVPKRADEPALVPVRIHIAADHVARARRLTLVVDHNPAPVAAVYNFGALYRTGGDVGDRSFETRVRLENMGRVRAVLETEGGGLYEASQFVAGTGGCTSTSLKNVEEAMRSLGKVRLKLEKDPTRGDLWHELVMQVRHPNFSGMQINTRTNTFTPAEFIEKFDVHVGSQHLVTIESGIAISEDPYFSLTFAKPNADTTTLIARDTNSRVFVARDR